MLWRGDLASGQWTRLPLPATPISRLIDLTDDGAGPAFGFVTGMKTGGLIVQTTSDGSRWERQVVAGACDEFPLVSGPGLYQWCPRGDGTMRLSFSSHLAPYEPLGVPIRGTVGTDVLGPVPLRRGAFVLVHGEGRVLTTSGSRSVPVPGVLEHWSDLASDGLWALTPRGTYVRGTDGSVGDTDTGRTWLRAR